MAGGSSGRKAGNIGEDEPEGWESGCIFRGFPLLGSSLWARPTNGSISLAIDW